MTRYYWRKILSSGRVERLPFPLQETFPITREDAFRIVNDWNRLSFGEGGSSNFAYWAEEL